MAVGDLLSGDYQFELRSVLMGDGTNYEIGAEGWGGFGTPEIRARQSVLPLEHGAVADREYADARELRLPMIIKGTTVANLLSNWQSVMEAWQPSQSGDVQAALQIGGSKFLLSGRPRGISDADTTHYGRLRIFAEATFVATDPRLYALTASTDTANVASAGSSRTYPLTYPRAYTSNSQATSTVTNSGTVLTAPSFSISGACVGPKVTNAAGDVLDLPSFTLGAGETLKLDSRTHEVLLDDSAYASDGSTLMRSYVTDASEWLTVAAGAGDTYTYEVAGFTASSTLTVTWRDAYL